MKKIFLFLFASAFAAKLSFGQTNIFPTSGNVGIGTATPSFPLSISRGGTNPSNDYAQLNISTTGNGNIYGPIIYLDGRSGTNGRLWGLCSSGPMDVPATGPAGNFVIYDGTAGTRLAINSSGYVGIGTIMPQAKFHVNDNASSSNAISEYSGNLIIQGNSTGRSSTTGASLEFVIPANTGGDNPWGQARIITVAGNSNSSDATGKLILGTRRTFDKGTGTGSTWNYGNDIVIDGSGHVGIGTSMPDQMLTVLGTIHAKQVNIDITVPGPDYVFDKNYKLTTLNDVNKYIMLNKHLPEIPSAKAMQRDGINVSDLNMKLLKKVEELTLYLIDKDKAIKVQETVNNEQTNQLKNQQEEINQLKEQMAQLAKKFK